MSWNGIKSFLRSITQLLTWEIEQCLDVDGPLIIMINNLKVLFVLIIIASIIFLYNLTSLETYNELYEEKYDRSMAYKGSSTRIKNKFKQALSGEHIKIGIVGGSISAGRKLEDAIKGWAAKQEDQPTKAEAIRRLVELGLASKGGKAKG